MKMKNNKMMNHWTGGVVLAGVSLLGLPALAQDVESLDNGVAAPAAQAQPAADKSARLPIAVTGGVSEQFKADIDKGGSFSLTRVKAGVSLPVRLNDAFTLSTSLRYEYDYYDFSGIPSLWKNINTLSASAILSWRVDEKWTAYGGGFVKMSAESGSALNQGTTGGGLIGFNYQVNETLSLGAGLALMSQLEDDTRVLPLITAKWKFDDSWRLDVGLTDVATTGYGAKLNWLFSKEVEFGLGAQYHKSRFRIDAANGVGQERSTTLFVDATWHACPPIDLNAFVGLATGGNVEVDNSTGHQLSESDYKAAAIIGARATVRF